MAPGVGELRGHSVPRCRAKCRLQRVVVRGSDALNLVDVGVVVAADRSAVLPRRRIRCPVRTGWLISSRLRSFRPWLPTYPICAKALPPSDCSTCRLKFTLYGERKSLATLNAPQGLPMGQGSVSVGVEITCTPLSITSLPTVALITGLIRRGCLPVRSEPRCRVGCPGTDSRSACRRTCPRRRESPCPSRNLADS